MVGQEPLLQLPIRQAPAGPRLPQKKISIYLYQESLEDLLVLRQPVALDILMASISGAGANCTLVSYGFRRDGWL